MNATQYAQGIECRPTKQQQVRAAHHKEWIECAGVRSFSLETNSFGLEPKARCILAHIQMHAYIRTDTCIHLHATKQGCMVREMHINGDADYTPRGRLAPRGARPPKNKKMVHVSPDQSMQSGRPHRTAMAASPWRLGPHPQEAAQQALQPRAKRLDPADAPLFGLGRIRH